MQDKCALCQVSINTEHVDEGLIRVIDGKLVHRICATDHFLRYGVQWSFWVLSAK